MKLKLIPVTDTSAVFGCRVVNEETGEEVENLISATYTHIAGSTPRIIVEFYDRTLRESGSSVDGTMVAKDIDKQELIFLSGPEIKPNE